MGNGNAAAIAECIQLMIHQGVLIPSWDEWTIDRDKLTTMSLSGDLVEMALGRLTELEADTKSVLIQAALWENAFLRRSWLGCTSIQPSVLDRL